MVRASLKLLVVDAVLLLSAYLVLQDLAWRSGYASQNGFTPSYLYSVLTQSFSMTGKGLALQTPLTLDWVQIIAVLLVVVNVWYLYGIVTRRSNANSPQAVNQTAQ
ncbi:MAG: hypothetical protein OK438_04080 [Thaumarchaeota archaeon]|nr:hypothetical protein [Nitrososphaerota archaeon]